MEHGTQKVRNIWSENVVIKPWNQRKLTENIRFYGSFLQRGPSKKHLKKDKIVEVSNKENKPEFWLKKL